jgi:hypothetical protein
VNTFASLVLLDDLSGPYVRFYSIQIEGKDRPEAIDFLERHKKDKGLTKKLQNLLLWLERIAVDYGALPDLFREEDKALALPPSPKGLKKLRGRYFETYIESNNLRLYVIRMNEHVVILLNGGVKTTEKAKDCPIVSPFFRQAQKIGDAIDEAQASREIIYNADKTDIIFDPTFELSIL